MEAIIWLVIYGLIGYYGLPILCEFVGVVITAVVIAFAICLIFGILKSFLPYIVPILIFLCVVALFAN